ncbi:MAG: hypothetical protein K1X79_06985 [Oligoflexia bacterium]|nr:hypothetical protein [Oligoflexia bacterium]
MRNYVIPTFLFGAFFAGLLSTSAAHAQTVGGNFYAIPPLVAPEVNVEIADQSNSPSSTGGMSDWEICGLNPGNSDNNEYSAFGCVASHGDVDSACATALRKRAWELNQRGLPSNFGTPISVSISFLSAPDECTGHAMDQGFICCYIIFAE